jgi:predicted ATP-dependent serine protease
MGLMIAKPKEFDLGIEESDLQSINDVVVPDYFYDKKSFGNTILDGVFNNGGLIKTQVLSVAAPRGSGKTTLLMQALQKLIDTNPTMRCAYFSNEECREQLAFTAKRIGVTSIKVGNASDIDALAEHMKTLDVMVIDSFPGLTHRTITSPKALENYAISTLVHAAKVTKCIVIFIMHFTKDGKEAGSKNFYHSVDTCIMLTKMEPDEFGGRCCREVNVTKNRIGSQSKVIIEMTATGFDLEHAIEAPSEESEEKGVYATRKEADVKKILDKVHNMPMIGLEQIQSQISDFAGLGIDMLRVERLLKELTNSQKLVMTGYGKGKRWAVPLEEA